MLTWPRNHGLGLQGLLLLSCPLVHSPLRLCIQKSRGAVNYGASFGLMRQLGFLISMVRVPFAGVSSFNDSGVSQVLRRCRNQLVI